MRLSPEHCALAAVVTSLALAAPPASAADCDLAIHHATYVAQQGARAFQSENFVVSGNEAGNARISAIDAARAAKACGCADAVPLLADAELTAARANLVQNIDGAKGYGARLKKDADAALEALRRCSAR